VAAKAAATEGAEDLNGFGSEPASPMMTAPITDFRTNPSPTEVAPGPGLESPRFTLEGDGALRVNSTSRKNPVYGDGDSGGDQGQERGADAGAAANNAATSSGGAPGEVKVGAKVTIQVFGDGTIRYHGPDKEDPSSGKVGSEGPVPLLRTCLARG